MCHLANAFCVSYTFSQWGLLSFIFSWTSQYTDHIKPSFFPFLFFFCVLMACTTSNLMCNLNMSIKSLQSAHICLEWKYQKTSNFVSVHHLMHPRKRQWQPTPVLLPGKSHGQRSLVGGSPWNREELDTTEDFTFTFHFHALEKDMATHSSVLAWRIPGTAGPGGLLSMELHRVGHDWSDLAAAACI